VQVTVVPVQLPPWQASAVVQAFPSLQVVPLAASASAGHVADAPVQFSATSHWPVDARHTVDEGLNGLAGQVDDEPVQVAARSQSAAAARHCVPALPTGCWQATLVPSHWSFVQGFPSSVQAVPLAFFASAGQLADVPVQVSAASHTSTAARQRVVEGRNPSAGQVTAVPLHVSATSHTPFAARQTVPLASGVQVPRCPARLHASQMPALQALSQQMPFVQKPEAHWLLLLQPRPNEPS
jgi:hypothetical protein